MKFICLIGFLFGMSIVHAHDVVVSKAPVALKNLALHVADGKEFGFDGNRVYRVIVLGKKLAEFYRKILIFSHDLVQQGHDVHSTSIESVNKALELLKEEFHELTVPFMADMDGFRPLVLDLIKESCSHRGRFNSFLLTWGSCPEGKELDSIKSHLKTTDEFQVFVVDLVHFLADLIHSCPKGYAQFVEMVAK
jgi:hypothetical protein